jgi:hypothetical protein
MTLLVLVYAGFSLLLIALSVPLIRGWVRPNAWYSFRIPLTLSDPAIWYPANRYAGQLLLVYTLVLLVVTPGLPLVLGMLPRGPATDLYAVSVAAVALVDIIVVLGLSLRYDRKLGEKYGVDDTH